MPNKRQLNRIYSLIVGTEDSAIEINNLNIRFNCVKTSSNKDRKNSAWVEIYNLTEERRKALEQPYVQVKLEVGYADTGLETLFVGQVVNIGTSKIKPFLTNRQGADLVTKLDLDEFYEELNTTYVSTLVPEGKSVGDAIKFIADGLEGITTTKMNGENVKKALPDGYPLSGSPIQNLNNLSENYDFDWQIDNTVLYISDREGSHRKEKEGVPLISQESGLVGRPEFVNEDAKRYRRQVEGRTAEFKDPKKNALKLTVLLNPVIVAGGIVKLEFEDLTGYYKVDEVVHRGGYRDTNWYSELTITEMV